jgi:hypothetical protein
MGLLFASPAPPRRAERQTGFALCQRFKSPKAASNLQFERPWDRLVPAKSARKLTARIIVSKKFWVVWDLIKVLGMLSAAHASCGERKHARFSE